MASGSSTSDDFDLESLVHLEQTFYDTGYKEGFSRGTVLGRREGEALGKQTGYELWDELGFYIGFASTWEAILAQQGSTDERLLQHISQLKRIISQFPFTDPAVDKNVDIPQLLGQVRSRYKALCARLGVRPTLRVSSSILEESQAPNTSDKYGQPNTSQRAKVWELESGSGTTSAQDLSF